MNQNPGMYQNWRQAAPMLLILAAIVSCGIGIARVAGAQPTFKRLSCPDGTCVTTWGDRSPVNPDLPPPEQLINVCIYLETDTDTAVICSDAAGQPLGSDFTLSFPKPPRPTADLYYRSQTCFVDASVDPESQCSTLSTDAAIRTAPPLPGRLQ